MAQAEPSDPFAIDTALDEVRKPAMGRIRAAGGLVIAAIAAAAVAVPLIVINDKKLEMVADLDRALNILAAGRAEVIGTWLDGTSGQTGRIVDSELFRLFSTEIDLAGGDISALIAQEQDGTTPALQSELGAPLVDQLPFMERVLTDFVISVDFLAGYLVGGAVSIVGAMLLMRIRRPLLIGGVACAAPLVLWAVFWQVLTIPLP